MLRNSVRGPSSGEFELFRRHASQVYERAALRTVDALARRGKTAIRSGMAGAGLGRLGNAIGSSSDAEKGTIKRYGRDDFAVSAAFFAKTRNERTLGALEAYTEGAEILPRRGKWLWIATDEIPRLTARERMTPARYIRNGFEQKIGPLQFVRSINGNPLLVVQGASVSAVGKPRSAKSRTKRGALRKGQRAKEFIVAFVGIPRTARAARVNLTEIIDGVRSEAAAIFAREVERGR